MKDSKTSEKLGDLAQVLPKGGRSLMILVGEKDVSFTYPILKRREQKRLDFGLWKAFVSIFG